VSQDPELVAGLQVGEMVLPWTLGVVGCALGTWLTADWSQLWLRVAAPVLLVGGLLALAAIRALGRGRELATTGPYRFVRHPYFLAILIMLVGAITAARSLPGLILLYIAVRLTIVRARREEHNLTLRFGPAYEAYAARVPFLLPLRPPLPRGWTPPENPGAAPQPS
jgi:protein-S-isoprenylcysteine O-methyltransferase Ste14